MKPKTWVLTSEFTVRLRKQFICVTNGDKKFIILYIYIKFSVAAFLKKLFIYFREYT